MRYLFHLRSLPGLCDLGVGGLQGAVLRRQTLEVQEPRVTQRDHIGETGEHVDLFLGELARFLIESAPIHRQSAVLEWHIDDPADEVQVILTLAASAVPHLAVLPVLDQA